MQQWENFKRALTPTVTEKNAVTCPKCNCTWLESVACNEYDANHQIVFGQNVPTKVANANPFILLRCVRCANLLEPIILYVSRDITPNNPYDRFLDTMEGKGDKRELTLEKTVETLTKEVAELKALLKKE
jgi:hypothetical protein